VLCAMLMMACWLMVPDVGKLIDKEVIYMSTSNRMVSRVEDSMTGKVGARAVRCAARIFINL